MNTKNTPSCLSCKNLYWTRDNKPILNDINFALQPGEVLGIIGPNGAGKSSLLKILAGVQQPDSGSLKLNGSEYNSFSTRQFAEQLSYLEQNSSVHWPLLVSKVISLGRLPYQGFSQEPSLADKEAISQALAATGIVSLLSRVVTTLSEGEKMLVALTRILATKTPIILADEPVAALDPYHQLLIMELLQNLTRTNENFSVVVVLHDLSLAARFCDRLMLMNQGSIASSGTIETVLNSDNLRTYYKINSDIDYAKRTVFPKSLIK
jgi:ABC-type cobalamin/Fe3+-siderophores transport system ATPase subunit